MDACEGVYSVRHVCAIEDRHKCPNNTLHVTKTVTIQQYDIVHTISAGLLFIRQAPRLCGLPTRQTDHRLELEGVAYGLLAPTLKIDTFCGFLRPQKIKLGGRALPTCHLPSCPLLEPVCPLCGRPFIEDTVCIT